MAATDRYLKVANKPFTQPVLLYDGHCTFCQMSVLRLAAWTGPRIEYIASLTAQERFPEIPLEHFNRSVQFVARDGQVSEGAAAVCRALAVAPPWGSIPLWLYQTIPGVALILEWLYVRVANNRYAISHVTVWLFGSDLRLPTFSIASDLFLRGLGVVYLCAFLSIWTQWNALYGPDGLLPLQEYLQLVREQFPDEKLRYAFSLFWLSDSQAFAHALLGVATLASVLLIAGILPLPALVICWAAYLSVCSIGQDFMSFQWDALLLETGFLAILCAPWVLRLSFLKSAEPHPLARWALWFLLFKLMFMSGVVKLASHDPLWRDGSALHFHFFTQPLPTWTSYYANNLPEWILKAGWLFLFFVELVVPFFIFAPRRLRHAAFLFFAALQLLIALTGNYGFFNLLALVLCLPLLDDTVFPRKLRALFGIKPPALQPPITEKCEQGCAIPSVRVPVVASAWEQRPLARRWRGEFVRPLLALLICYSALAMLYRFQYRFTRHALIHRIFDLAEPIRVVSTYGLFATMTDTRDEIIIEGSEDGVTWRAYEFRYKPGDPKRRPVFTGPHMPRVDWQLWFAAMGNWRQHEWFPRILKGIFENRPVVLSLFANNPFPEKPPKHLRARLFRYTFSDKQDGTWWTREDRGIYFPVVTKK